MPRVAEERCEERDSKRWRNVASSARAGLSGGLELFGGVWRCFHLRPWFQKWCHLLCPLEKRTNTCVTPALCHAHLPKNQGLKSFSSASIVFQGNRFFERPLAMVLCIFTISTKRRILNSTEVILTVLHMFDSGPYLVSLNLEHKFKTNPIQCPKGPPVYQFIGIVQPEA